MGFTSIYANEINSSNRILSENSIFFLIKQENLKRNKNLSSAFKNSLNGKRKLNFFDNCRKNLLNSTFNSAQITKLKISDKISSRINLQRYNIDKNKIKNIHAFLDINGDNMMKQLDFLTRKKFLFNSTADEKKIEYAAIDDKLQPSHELLFENTTICYNYSRRLELIKSKLESSALNKSFGEIFLLDFSDRKGKLNIYSMIEIKNLKNDKNFTYDKSSKIIINESIKNY